MLFYLWWAVASKTLTFYILELHVLLFSLSLSIFFKFFFYLSSALYYNHLYLKKTERPDNADLNCTSTCTVRCQSQGDNERHQCFLCSWYKAIYLRKWEKMYMSNETLQFISIYFDPCVIHISEPVTESCPVKELRAHVEVSHDRRHWRTHGTAMFLS